MEDDEVERIKALYIADLQKWIDDSVLGSSREASIESVGKMYEQIAGQPVLVQRDGEKLTISWPVIDRSRIK